MYKKLLIFILLICIGFFIQTAEAQTWSSLFRLTWSSGNSFTPNACIDSGGNIHLVWVDQSPGNPEIYYKKKPGSGTSFSAPKRLTWTPIGSQAPFVATHSSLNIYVAWYESSMSSGDIYFKRSSDGGSTWSPPQRLTWNSGASQNPIMVTESAAIIHLFWEDYNPGNAEIFYKKSTDNGSTWGPPQRLTWNSGFSGNPAAAFAGISNIIHLVWEDDTPGLSEIYYKKSGTSGTTWSAPVRLTWNAGWSQTPAICVDSSQYVHVTWEDDTPGNFEIYYKKSTDSSSTWSALSRLTWNLEMSLVPDVAVDSFNNLFIVWEDDTPGNFEIFFKESTDTGSTWSTPLRLTWNNGGSRNPDITEGFSSDIHVFWNDSSPGPFEIYYKNRK